VLEEYFERNLRFELGDAERRGLAEFLQRASRARPARARALALAPDLARR
jgi:predicted solute-binding protein